MSLKDGGPAFPVLEGDTQWLGMSLRDYFAAKAMQGYLSGHIAHYGHDNFWETSSLVEGAYAMADAMLRAREEA